MLGLQSVKNILSGYETLYRCQNPLDTLETDWSPFFELMPSGSWDLEGTVIEQGPSGSSLPVPLDSTELAHYIVKHKFLQTLLRK